MMTPQQKELNDSSQLYDVERIDGKKIVDGRVMYLVKWLGYDVSDNTWEPLRNLMSCFEYIEEYEDFLHKMKCHDGPMNGQKRVMVKIDDDDEPTKRMKKGDDDQEEENSIQFAHTNSNEIIPPKDSKMSQQGKGEHDEEVKVNFLKNEDVKVKLENEEINVKLEHEEVKVILLENEQVKVNLLENEEIKVKLENEEIKVKLETEEVKVNLLESEEVEVNLLQNEQVKVNLLENEQVKVNLLENEEVKVILLKNEEVNNSLMDRSPGQKSKVSFSDAATQSPQSPQGHQKLGEILLLDKILKKKTENGRVFYLARWLGRGNRFEDTWEPIQSFSICPRIIQIYERKQLEREQQSQRLRKMIEDRQKQREITKRLFAQAHHHPFPHPDHQYFK